MILEYEAEAVKPSVDELERLRRRLLDPWLVGVSASSKMFKLVDWR
jgi:hypothetical protein